MTRKFLGRNWFTIGILAAVAAAFLLPGGGALNTGSRITNAITIVLFLFIGLTLPSETILGDLRGARLHLFVPVFIFIANPLYFFLSTRPFARAMEPALLAGIYALSCLPTTISSCIVFTQSTGENTAGAVFHSALSNVLGVFLSPLLLSLLIREAGRGLPAAELAGILAGIGLRMLLPLAIGQLARIPLRAWAAARTGIFGIVSNILILFLIYFAAASAASAPQLASMLGRNALLFLYLAVSAPLVLLLAWLGGAPGRAPEKGRDHGSVHGVPEDHGHGHPPDLRLSRLAPRPAGHRCPAHRVLPPLAAHDERGGPQPFPASVLTRGGGLCIIACPVEQEEQWQRAIGERA